MVLPEKDWFRYLGMLLDRRMNPKIAAEEHAARPYMAAQSRISEFAKSHDLKSRPHAMLWLSKVYGIPADRLFLFLSELMDLFVAGRDQSAADQSNYLAEGHPPL